MSQTKAQLIQPIGVVTAGGVVVTGVVTASSFDGDVVGTATSIISGANLNVGIISATNFSGDFTGTATGIKTGAAIKVGSFTATNFTGDFTGTATSMMRGTGFEAGAINATGFNVSGTTTGNVTGDITGNISGNVTGNVTGNVIAGTAGSVASGANIHVGVLTAITFSGDGSNLSGIAATNFNTQVVPDNKTFSINVTSPAGGNYTLSGTDRSGTVSGSSDPAVTVEIGDTLNFVVDASGHPFYIRVSDGGANVSTPAATNQGATDGTVSWTPNTAGTYYYQCGNHAGMLGTITVTSTTTIDLSSGNCITFNQSASTTVAFANTSAAMDVTIIRVKDANDTARTITWPDSVKWNGGSAPTLINDSASGDSQQFQFLTRDSGLTWYGWEPFAYDGPYKNSTLYTWGSNSYGMLGFSQSPGNHKSSPTQIGSAEKWIPYASRDGHKTSQLTAAINMDGELWVFGDNRYGALGQGDRTERSSPVQVDGSTWNSSCKYAYGMLAGKSDGTLWSWGYGQDGALGLNQGSSPTHIGISSPTQIPGTTWSKNISRTSKFSAVVKTDGTLWTWGNGGVGKLGLNSNTERSSPTQVGTDTTWATGYQKSSFTDSCMCAIKTDGTLWSWGYSGKVGHGQSLNPNANRSSPIQIPGTTWDTISGSYRGFGAVKTDGTLWMWGQNFYGTLGQNANGNPGDRSSPMQIPGTTWSKISGDVQSFVALKTDGTAWAWGRSDKGQLGINNTTSYSSPVQIAGTDWTGLVSAGSAILGYKDAT
jgi:alpha-tubulin suppressor-like RCC1 family protein